MDVLSSMQNAVSGLRAQAYALDNIAGNIANSQTTGFKRVDTSFLDLIPDQPQGLEVAGSVGAYSRLTNTLQGNIAATGVTTNMALNGSGFFAVQAKSGDASGASSFAGQPFYTRRGDFTLDKDGHLVNGAGLYLKGATLDPSSGRVLDSGPKVLTISDTPITAHETSQVNYAGNLPLTPSTSSGDALMTVAPASGPVPASDAATFVGQTVSGGSLTLYSAAGAPVTLQMRWAKTANGDATATPPTGGTWNLFYQNNSSSTASGTDPVWESIGADFKFDAAGKLTAPTTPVAVTGLSVDGVGFDKVTFNFGTDALTSQASVGGLVTTTTLQQDGYGTGTLNSVSVGSDGVISGTYSNGRILPLAQAGVVQFRNENGLKREDGGAYSETLSSGSPLAGLKGTTISSGNIEQSNTDTAEEFSKLIVTQQAYSANTKVLTTAQQMASDLLNVIR